MNVDTSGELRSSLLNLKNRLNQPSIRRSDGPKNQATIKEVDAALQRMEQGTYGICESCHLVIPTGQLLQQPHVRICRECRVRQTRLERTRRESNAA